MFNRKVFLLLAASIILMLIAAQCSVPPATEEKVVLQTVVVEVEKQVAAPADKLPMSLDEFTQIESFQFCSSTPVSLLFS